MIYFYYTHTLSNCRQCGLVVKNGLQIQASGWPLTSYFLCVFLQLKREMIIAPTPTPTPDPRQAAIFAETLEPGSPGLQILWLSYY